MAAARLAALRHRGRSGGGCDRLAETNMPRAMSTIARADNSMQHGSMPILQIPRLVTARALLFTVVLAATALSAPTDVWPRDAGHHTGGPTVANAVATGSLRSERTRLADEVARTSANPGSEWRDTLFWAWNDMLDPDELRRQVREIKQSGLGGFFIHARTGLVTPFLGERWMQCVAAAVDEARKQGLQAWLYDEDRYPSGSGGGLVTKRNPGFGIRFLELRSDEGAGYRFALRSKQGHVSAYRRLRSGEGPRPGEGFWRFQAGAGGPASLFNGAPYSDNMDPNAVNNFLSTCYEPYRKQFSAEFGRTIPGIFTDEPNVLTLPGMAPVDRIPWTRRLPAEFSRRRGYDIVSRLPKLFSNESQFFKTRHDFWRTVTEHFSEAYAKHMGEWCARNDLALTGHMLAEQDLEDGIPVGGAATPILRLVAPRGKQDGAVGAPKFRDTRGHRNPARRRTGPQTGWARRRAGVEGPTCVIVQRPTVTSVPRTRGQA